MNLNFFLFTLAQITLRIGADIEYFKETLFETEPQSILEFDCVRDANTLWLFFSDVIDTNKNSLIDKTEMRNFLISKFKTIHEREFDDQLKKFDPNNTGVVDFKSYANETFDSLYDLLIEHANLLEMENDLKAAAANTQDNYDELVGLFALEKNKWLNFSRTNNQTLNHEQFYKFLYTEEFPTLRESEKEITFRSYDFNHDSHLSVDEFTLSNKNVDESVVNLKRKRFTKVIDTDGDNLLSMGEFKAWYELFNLNDVVDEQIEYLFKYVDENGDKFLDEREIKANCEKVIKIELFVEFEETSQTSHHFNDEL